MWLEIVETFNEMKNIGKNKLKYGRKEEQVLEKEYTSQPSKD